MKIALIDADFMIYVIGHGITVELGVTHEQTAEELPQEQIVVRVLDKLQSIVSWIVVETGCSHVRLAYSSLTPVFRYDVYELDEYKGGRPVKSPLTKLVESTLRNNEMYQHYTIEGLEADDLICYWAWQCRMDKVDYVVCSPDKDMKQVPGQYFKCKGDSTGIETITEDMALYYRNLQLITGDTTDRILGVPGMGPVKAEKLLKENQGDPIGAIAALYTRHFGQKFGRIFFRQTIDTVTMMTPYHSFHSNFTQDLGVEFNSTEVSASVADTANPFI